MCLKMSKPWVFALLSMLLLANTPVFGEPATNQTLRAQAEAAYERAWKIYQTNTASATAACQLAWAGSELADFATNDTQHAQIARQGIAVCRELLKR
jgi:hypothetical protein